MQTGLRNVARRMLDAGWVGVYHKCVFILVRMLVVNVQSHVGVCTCLPRHLVQLFMTCTCCALISTAGPVTWYSSTVCVIICVASKHVRISYQRPWDSSSMSTYLYTSASSLLSECAVSLRCAAERAAIVCMQFMGLRLARA